MISYLSEYNHTNFIQFNSQDLTLDLESAVECEDGRFWSAGKSFETRLVGIRFYSGPAFFTLKFPIVKYITHSSHAFVIELRKYYQNILNPMKVF